MDCIRVLQVNISFWNAGSTLQRQLQVVGIGRRNWVSPADLTSPAGVILLQHIKLTHADGVEANHGAAELHSSISVTGSLRLVLLAIAH